jgi:hypothetical protein
MVSWRDPDLQPPVPLIPSVDLMTKRVKRGLEVAEPGLVIVNDARSGKLRHP